MNLLSPIRPPGLRPPGRSSTPRIIVIGAVGSAVLLLLGLLTIPMLIVGGISLFSSDDGSGCTNTNTVNQPAASASANSIPANYLKWYKTVGQQYGIPWTVLAGIGTVESDNGQSTLPGVHSGQNGFGAAGPMQIGIGGASTDNWATLATAEDGIEPPSVYDPADAIAGAAKYLIAHGAKTDLADAIFAYNHATWYVQEVEADASKYAAGGYTVAASVTGCTPQTSALASVTTPNQTVSAALQFAEEQLGKPYLFGGTGPDSFDCSGLVMMAYRAAGVYIERTSEDQWATETRVSAADVQPGDLVFFAGADGTMTDPGHVGIVINPATHTMIDAYATGFNVEIDTYGLSTSKGGLSPVVGFTSPWEPQH
ncbi:MAG: NlpC/P60 family protein [Streptosporangiaceae bacterium]|jgi:cell wall-associated NlpC family hydrolase